MRRLISFLATFAVVGGLALAGIGLAQGGPPEHKHMLVLGLEFDEMYNPIGFRKCVDLAAGRALPNNAHHQHMHTGAAGAALFGRAGHLVVPGTPLTPYANCAALIELLSQP